MTKTHSIKNHFGETIREAREKANLGLREAAFKIKINPGYLSSLENNFHKAIPSDPVIKKLSDLLNLDFDKLKDLAIAINPAKGIKNRITEKDAKGMQAFYRFLKRRGMTIEMAVELLEAVFESKGYENHPFKRPYEQFETEQINDQKYV